MHIQPDHISPFLHICPPLISVALRKLLQKPFKNPLRTLRELFGSVPEYIAHPARPYHILTYSHKQYLLIFTMSGKATTIFSKQFFDQMNAFYRNFAFKSAHTQHYTQKSLSAHNSLSGWQKWLIIY
jgi:hypothetical protein